MSEIEGQLERDEGVPPAGAVGSSPGAEQGLEGTHRKPQVQMLKVQNVLLNEVMYINSYLLLLYFVNRYII